jgi:hypothetical protein
MRKSSNKLVILFARWQKLLDEGVYTSVSEIGDAENLDVQHMEDRSKSVNTHRLWRRTDRVGRANFVRYRLALKR